MVYKVLLVEDESIIRKWLKKSVDWQKHHLVVCGEACNGAEALEVYEREKPDIVLTDLRMPVMDGLTMLGHIRAKDKRIRFLVLTCFDEFNLVQQAVELDVTSYILKLTSEPEEIGQKMKKAREYLQWFD